MKKSDLYKHNERIGNCLSITQDVCSNSSIITITGTMQVLVENYRGLSEYTSERIVLEGLRNLIIVQGKKLYIHAFNNEDCLISGFISNVSFENRPED
mgnify:CR=1 FL=1